MAAQALPARQRRGVHWVFTSFAIAINRNFDPLIVRYVVYQQEVCPETGTDHFQGYIEFFDKKRRGGVQTAIGDSVAYVARRFASRSVARAYCLKDESRKEGTVPFEFGLWRLDVCEKVKLKDLLKTDMTLEEVKVQHPMMYVRYHKGLERLYAFRQKKKAEQFRDVKVRCFIGDPGTGKTRQATSGTNWYKMPIGDKMWFDYYDGEKTLVIDDFNGGINYYQLLSVLDGYKLLCPVKGGFVYAMWTTVIITSTAHPRNWYPKRGFTAALRRRITEIREFDPLSE